jgi:putative nucleotidyltransferase with HDIG domain
LTTDRKELWPILRQHVHSDVLLKHSLAVETAMRAYAGKFGEDVDYWGAVGLLHDIDFDKYPDDHPNHAREILAAHGFGDAFITDVESHARDWAGERSMLQKTLLALDELTGFIIACALVRPDKSLANVEVKSVLKKMKDKAFARAVTRDTIPAGAAAMGVDFAEHVDFVRTALASANGKTELPLVG